jgi:isocitrate dehydrogenase
MEFIPDDGSEGLQEVVHHFKKGGIYLGMFNTDRSIAQFAHNCFTYALMRNIPMKLSTKNTILKKYDGRFKDIFEEIYEIDYKEEFKALGLDYEHRLIDDMVA